MTTFRHNAQEITITLADKAKVMGIEKLHVQGLRWFQKSYGNTYHTAAISALIDGKYVELGKTKMQYGYGEQYLVSAGAWLIENGFLDCQEKEGYALSHYQVREIFNIEHMATDVKKKAYL